MNTAGRILFVRGSTIAVGAAEGIFVASRGSLGYGISTRKSGHTI